MKKFLMIIILGSYVSLLQSYTIRLDNDVIINEDDTNLLATYSRYFEDFFNKMLGSTDPEFDFRKKQYTKDEVLDRLNKDNGWFLKKIIQCLQIIYSSNGVLTPENTKKISNALSQKNDFESILSLLQLTQDLKIEILEKIWFTITIDQIFLEMKTEKKYNDLINQYKNQNSLFYNLIKTLDKTENSEIKEKIRSKLAENGFTSESNDNLLTQYFNEAAAKQKPSIESSSWSSWIRQHFKKLLSVLGVAGVAALIYKLSKRGAQHTPSPTPQ